MDRLSFVNVTMKIILAIMTTAAMCRSSRFPCWTKENKGKEIRYIYMSVERTRDTRKQQQQQQQQEWQAVLCSNGIYEMFAVVAFCVCYCRRLAAPKAAGTEREQTSKLANIEKKGTWFYLTWMVSSVKIDEERRRTTPN
jgi:hypothetical protein